jgi:pyrrolysyl-tRNA synthetase-like protein
MAQARRYYRKRQRLLAMVAKIKLWPSRKGRLHGVRTITATASGFEVETHCGLVFGSRDSANSRAARWLRAKQYAAACPDCRIPAWKLEKYGSTVFSKRQGGVLPSGRPEPGSEGPGQPAGPAGDRRRG